MSEENVEAARRFHPGAVDVVALLDHSQFVAFYGPLVEPEFETVGDALAMGVDDEAARRRERAPACVLASRA